MSESEKSLEDFFAKKSKKKGGKGKGNKKFTTSDEIAKKLAEQPKGQDWQGTPTSISSEATPKKSKQPEETKDENESETNMNYRFQDDEEWTDFHDDSKKDYTGLKVQALQISDEQQEGDNEDEEVDENGEPIRNKGQGASGPWNKLNPDAGTAAPTPQVTVEREPPPVEEPKPAAPAPGKYVPPGRRGAAANAPPSGGSSLSATKLTRKSKTPQINSEFEFPTLAASSDLVKHSNKGDDATFSTVTRGGQAVDGTASKGADLQLGNRFAALEN